MDANFCTIVESTFAKVFLRTNNFVCRRPSADLFVAPARGDLGGSPGQKSRTNSTESSIKIPEIEISNLPLYGRFYFVFGQKMIHT